MTETPPFVPTGSYTPPTVSAGSARATLESIPGDGTFRVKHEGIQFQFQGYHLLTVMRRKNAK